MGSHADNSEPLSLFPTDPESIAQIEAGKTRHPASGRHVKNTTSLSPQGSLFTDVGHVVDETVDPNDIVDAPVSYEEDLSQVPLRDAETGEPLQNISREVPNKTKREKLSSDVIKAAIQKGIDASHKQINGIGDETDPSQN